MILTNRAQFVSTVADNVPLCREHFRLVLKLPAFPATAPGQFIQIACRDLGLDYSPERESEWSPGRPLDVEGQELMAPLALLRRPFSLAGRRDAADGVELDIIHRVVGVGTDWMARLQRGDRVDILGPLGNQFELPEEGEMAVLVGGGVGIPPMLYLAEKLADRPAVAFCGAVSRELVPLRLRNGMGQGVEPGMIVEEFARHGIASVVTTDDGSYGFRGYVTQALEGYLDGIGASGPAVIYTCGPEPMMKRVAEIATARGLECQVAVERAMACGMGTCQSCVIRVKTDGSGFSIPPSKTGDWVYKLACTDGPIFRAADLLW